MLIAAVIRAWVSDAAEMGQDPKETGGRAPKGEGYSLQGGLSAACFI